MASEKQKPVIIHTPATPVNYTFMESSKLEIVIYGIIGILLGLSLCALGIRLFSLETPESTHTFGIFGIPFKGKTLAAVLTWSGLITLFFVIRRMRKYLSH